jgi:CHAT domain-containing protein/Tfp pilus assembly protein PilF
MNKKLISFLTMIMVLGIMTGAAFTKNIFAAIDEKSFKKEFVEALKSKDQAKIQELVKKAPHFVYKVVIGLSGEGIRFVAEGKDGSRSFAASEAIATIYAKVFKKEGLVELVRRYKSYTPEMCRERLRGGDLFNEGISFDQKGQWKEALNKWTDALKIFRKIGDVAAEAKSLNSIGVVYDNFGQYAKALEYDQRALEIDRKIGNAAGEAASLGNIGNVYLCIGQHKKALEYLRRSLRINRRIGDEAGMVISIFGIVNVYYKLGQYDKALEYYQEVLKIERKIGDSAGEAVSLGNIGLVYKSLGEYAKALDYYQQSLEIKRKIGDRAGEARSLGNIGVVYNKLGQYSKAIQPFRETIEISEVIGQLETVWGSCQGLGQALWKSGKAEEAVVHYKKAVDTIEVLYQHTTGFKEEERSSMIGEKHFVYKEFIDLLLELYRKHPRKGYDCQAFTIAEKSKSRTFQELMAKAGAKITFAEEAKDETFKKMIEQERQLIIEITNLRTLLTKEVSKPENQRNQEVVDSLKGQLSKPEKALRKLKKEIDAKYPRYADLKRPKPLTVEELQEILKPDETVLAYAVGKDKIAVFVITKDSFKMVELSVSPKDLAQLVKQFRKGLDGIYELKDLEEFNPEVAYTLYQQLVEPLSAELKGVNKLYISADGILYTLPFEALVDQEVNKEAFREARRQGRSGQGASLGEYATLHYLVDTYTITYLPSASVLRSMRKYEKPGYGKWNKPLIAFADPIFREEEIIEEAKVKVEVKDNDLKPKGVSQETALTLQILTRSTGGQKLQRLKESSQEAEAISKEVKGKKEDIYLRERATEENVYKTSLKDSRYILFSTHGLLGGDFSGVAEPALALTLIDNPPGRDGFLTMSEVLGLDLNAELTILSACNTSGKGEKAGSGEGFVGLTRSFMYAGGKSLLVTHWSVESESARDLMVGAMKLMKNKTKPEALREAKLNMKKSIRQTGNEKLSLSHPFFWAPFVLVGEGK